MSARRLAALICTVLLGLGSARPVAAVVQHTILGRAFAAKDPSAGADPTKRRVVATAKELSSAVLLAGDPTADGGTTVVETNAIGLSVALPAGGWRATRNGYRYADRDGTNGPARSVVIQRNPRGTLTIKIVMSGDDAALPIAPPNPGTEAAIAVVIGGNEAYCAHYGDEAGGVITNDGARLFRVKRPTATGPCPSIVVPTTTTTSSTTTTVLCGEVGGPPVCWGACPPDVPVCADVGGACLCVPGSTPCKGLTGIECDGTCPAGEICVSGAVDCGCMPAGQTPCFGQSGTTCGGFCPPDESCQLLHVAGLDFCGCPPPACGIAPACGGSCPPGRNCQIVFIPEQGDACLCMPTP